MSDERQRLGEASIAARAAFLADPTSKQEFREQRERMQRDLVTLQARHPARTPREIRDRAEKVASAITRLAFLINRPISVEQHYPFGSFGSGDMREEIRQPWRFNQSCYVCRRPVRLIVGDDEFDQLIEHPKGEHHLHHVHEHDLFFAGMLDRLYESHQCDFESLTDREAGPCFERAEREAVRLMGLADAAQRDQRRRAGF